MNEKTFSWKEADELEKKLAKDLAALEEKQAADRQRIQEARRASAGDALEEVLNTLTNISGYLTDGQKAQVSNFFGSAKKGGKSAGSKPRNTVPKELRAHNRFLHDGKKTPFYYGGKGPKPETLKHFEASEAGVKLIKDNKPTYGDL
ncbi:hypothetical protein D7Y42_02115 [Stenotrophomonas maltophilia]|uniref:hypothetical protein n=1 Tax=Stenotrophomonas maltophilia TaxID=40324 RepID=UPI0015DDF88C|nr:hypothetical protein [Stenotrophomonas maltophilia]MBA0369506.1 hypothetical protein [Stenotrophomonas maltophilia]